MVKRPFAAEVAPKRVRMPTQRKLTFKLFENDISTVYFEFIVIDNIPSVLFLVFFLFDKYKLLKAFYQAKLFE